MSPTCWVLIIHERDYHILTIQLVTKPGKPLFMVVDIYIYIYKHTHTHINSQDPEKIQLDFNCVFNFASRVLFNFLFCAK